MSEMKWEPAKITRRSLPKKKAYARITKNSVTFNGVAAGLIEDIEKYPWAEILVGKVDDEPTMLAFKFTEEETPKSLPVKKQSKNHKGVTFFSREMVKTYFNLGGVGALFMRLDVEQVNDVTLGIRLLTEENLSEELGLDSLEEKLNSLL